MSSSDRNIVSMKQAQSKRLSGTHSICKAEWLKDAGLNG